MAHGLFNQKGQTTPARILIAKRFFDTNPKGTIQTGAWTEPKMDKADFYAWFRRCLNLKTGGEVMTHSDHVLMRDCRYVNDYLQNRIRHSGCKNLLSNPRLKRRYPQIDNQETETV